MKIYLVKNWGQIIHIIQDPEHLMIVASAYTV